MFMQFERKCHGGHRRGCSKSYAKRPDRFANPSPPSGRIEDFHFRAAEHARHTTKPPAAADATRGHAQNIYLSQPNSSSIDPVMIAKRPFAKFVFVRIDELLSTHGVRLLSP